ncbi:hypothetical protein HK100_005005 [Physocladia obscura]|uniref:ATP synthase F0 subunit 8 n=1 Tax=Physocladia obscura TaxID=109957 RepID=A0AAD5XDI7_9FUNG|nr:hypothetical protein HK100_005005 [Physocladia obscura]
MISWMLTLLWVASILCVVASSLTTSISVAKKRDTTAEGTQAIQIVEGVWVAWVIFVVAVCLCIFKRKIRGKKDSQMLDGNSKLAGSGGGHVVEVTV